MTSSSERPQRGLSTKKRIAFAIILVAFPIFVLVSAEVLLRVFEYGGDLRLVVQRTLNGKEYYSINRSVGRRYFAHAGVAIPEPADDTFEITKPKNTIRIFCLGESTMAGFPYEFNATAPSMLRDRLVNVLPTYNVEVINVALAAVGSYVVLDFINDLVNYEPDLFLIYVGHNEFYGVYQAGSSLTVGSRWITRLNLWLLKFKTYLLLRDGIASTQSLFGRHTGSGGEVLMEQMIGQQSIPYHSEVYKTGKTTYAKNLNAVINVARSAGVPILFSTLVSNLRTQAPFQGIFAGHTTTQERDRYDSLVIVGDGAARRGDLPTASDYFKQATTIDSLNATGFYKLGLVLYAQEQFVEAKDYLNKAKDYDGLRFRVAEEFQSELLRTCRELHVPITRVDSAFTEQSPHGIIGSELMTEHLHPNVEGYFLMAKTWLKTIVENKLLVPAEAWDWSRDLSDSAYSQFAPITDFDRITGAIKIQLLMHRPPFVKGGVHYEFIPKNEVEKIAYRYVREEIFWSDARYKLAEYYASQKDFQRARAECRSLAKVVPSAYQPLVQIADYFQMEGKRKEAEAEYLNSIKREDNPFAHMKLAYLYLEEEKPVDAVSHLEQAFALTSNKRFTVSTDALTLSRYLLAVAYAQLGKFSAATENAQRVLTMDPRHAETLDLLQQIRQLQQQASRKR